MKKGIFSGFLLLFVLGWATVWGQNPVFDTDNAEITDWKYAVSKNPADLKVGDIFTVTFSGHVKEDRWHIYSAKPAPGGMGYSATEFKIFAKETKGLVKSGSMRDKNVATAYWDDIMEDTVRYFKQHDVSFSQDFKITCATVELEGAFGYQICVDPESGGQCRFPSLPFTWKFKAKGPECGEPGKVEGNDPKENTDSETVQSGDPAAIGDCKGCIESVLYNSRIDQRGNIIPRKAAVDAENQAEMKSLNERLDSQTARNEAAAGGLAVEGESAAEAKKQEKDTSYWWLFLQAFLFGFAAVFTPCVFPMIPLTVSFFTKSSSNRAKGIRNALTYAFFIIFIYTAIGLFVSVVFGDDFLYLMSINPWVNLGFFTLLFVFALSFFGMFEITLPSSWANKMDQKSDRGGLLGIFFMALTLAVVSFSCTGPLVGTALIEAADGSLWGPTVSMLGFSSALAIPFALFAIFPGWMNSMPKSGGWLNSVKVVLGFLEIALGMKFLSQTDLILKWHLLDRELFIGIWIVVFFLLGLYLIGKIKLPGDSEGGKISVPQLVLAIFSFSFVMYLAPGLWGAQLPAISGLLPPQNRDIGVKILGLKEMNPGMLNGEICQLPDRKYYDIFEEKEAHGFCTFYDLEEGLEYARLWNRPVFLDFTGHTCANCREMENRVWHRPEVAKALKEDFIMISLYADEDGELEEAETIGGKKVRSIGTKNFQLQKLLYNTIAQPYYAVVDYDLNNMVRPRGYNPNVKEYLNFLQDGKATFEKVHGEPLK
ncbi:MAG: thioredoxin family protein [Bacteroidia bacterium]|nr:thioredoxin family protein [Bacteroidia bacterium]